MVYGPGLDVRSRDRTGQIRLLRVASRVPSRTSPGLAVRWLWSASIDMFLLLLRLALGRVVQDAGLAPQKALAPRVTRGVAVPGGTTGLGKHPGKRAQRRGRDALSCLSPRYALVGSSFYGVACVEL